MPRCVALWSRVAAISLVPVLQGAAQVHHVAAWQRLFDSSGVTGAVLLYDAQRGLRASDTARVRVPVLPASTFKIFSTLVALDAGVVAGPQAIFRWDGRNRCVADWNRDLTLRQAYHASAFWVYQRLVRQVGAERMQRALTRAEYGNRNMSGGLDRFWLDGGLRISMLQQVNMLRRLAAQQLPFSANAISDVLDIMVEQRGADFVLRGKTGWGRQLTASGDRFGDCLPNATDSLGPALSPEVGWYVGYIVKGQRTVFFALNMDISKPQDAAARRAIVRRILSDEGLLGDPRS